MRPVRVAPMPAAAGGGGCRGSPFSHSRDIEIVELLAPQHSGQRLTLHQPHVRIRDVLLERRIECVRVLLGALPLTASKSSKPACVGTSASRTRTVRFRPLTAQTIMCSSLGSTTLGIDRASVSAHDIIIDAVFEIMARRVHSPNSRRTLVSFSQKELRAGRRNEAAWGQIS